MTDSTDMLDTHKVFVHQFEAAVFQIEGICLVLRCPPDRRLDVVITNKASYVPRSGQRLVRPAAAGDGSHGSRNRRIGTIANRIRDLLPTTAFVLYDPTHPDGWKGRYEFYPGNRLANFTTLLQPQVVAVTDVDVASLKRHRAPGEQ